ncbi:MAG: hypothetical protein V4622_13540 [Bacteroidota bacterium]
MKKLILFIFLFATTVFSQNTKIPRFTKSKIGNSSSWAYLPSQNPQFTTSFSEDSSVIYTFEETIGEHEFMMLQVDFSEPIIDSLEQEALLISYLDFLKTQFNITQSVGYGRGHFLESNPKTHGVIDYCEDEAKNKYQLKGWINTNHLTVYFIYGKEEYPNLNIRNMFFDGIRYE